MSAAGSSGESAGQVARVVVEDDGLRLRHLAVSSFTL